MCVRERIREELRERANVRDVRHVLPDARDPYFPADEVERKKEKQHGSTDAAGGALQRMDGAHAAHHGRMDS